jgi:SAM-dependent methyltransferase
VEKGQEGSMEGLMRRPYQGVANIIRFNWHFYVIAIAIIILMVIAWLLTSNILGNAILIVALMSALSLLFSLFISYYVYDRSALYRLDWLKDLNIKQQDVLININAGFDETSSIIASQFPDTLLHVFDFYDPERHTEVSIERARRRYAVYPGTKKISTDAIPLSNASVNFALAILAAHEIRDTEERVRFLKEIKRALKPGGKLVVVEHLRDLQNFLAYTIGFFHFFSKKQWKDNFTAAGFKLAEERKVTPFISVFILSINGTAS